MCVVTERGRSSILGASVVSAFGTGLSRVLGAVRDIAIGHVFGAGRASDAFWMAWTIPSLFRRFVADEGLTGALIPGVAKAEQEIDTGEARRLANGALLALLVAGALICVGGMLGAPWLVRLIAPGFAGDPGKLQLTVTLTRWLFPFVVFVSLVSYCEGLLNFRGHFFVPKVAPGIVSGCIAAAALFLAGGFAEPVFALVVGVLVGGLTHLLVCIPPLVMRWGMPVPSLRGMRGPRFRFFLGEMGKVAAIGIIAQLNVVLLRVLASFLEEGSMTHYWYANRLVDLTQGTIAVAVSSALLPAVARDAAARDWDRFRENFGEAVRLAALVLLPVAFLLVGLARPIVSVLFLHGEFSAVAASRTAATLQLLVPFMVALGGINIVKKAYFALDDRTTLLVVGAIGLGFTGVAGYLLSSRIGVEGLGLALSISGIAQLLAYLAILRVKMGERLGLASLVVPLLKLLAASLPAALGAVWVGGYGDWGKGPADLGNWFFLFAAGLLAAATYLAVAWSLGVKEIREVPRRIRKVREPRD
jgi:putative peptidoglycan lipid II flippase